MAGVAVVGAEGALVADVLVGWLLEGSAEWTAETRRWDGAETDLKQGW